MSLTDGDLPTLEKRRETLLAYLRDKVESEDFHGVADCAMDLREVDAAIQVVKRVSSYGSSHLFQPFVEPEPTVRCKCGWTGVGIQTKVGVPSSIYNEETEEWSHPKPRCPKCNKDNHLKYKKDGQWIVEKDEPV